MWIRPGVLHDVSSKRLAKIVTAAQQKLQNGAARQLKLRVLETCELEVVMLVLMFIQCNCEAVRVVFL